MAELKLLQCPICDTEFMQRHGNQRYCCSKCQIVSKRRRRKVVDKARNDRNRAEVKKKRAKRKKNISELAEINQRARAAGMTYGKYMAQEYGKQVQVRRK